MSRELLPENKYMLDLKEASAFYGIGIKRCRRIADTLAGKETDHYEV